MRSLKLIIPAPTKFFDTVYAVKYSKILYSALFVWRKYSHEGHFNKLQSFTTISITFEEMSDSVSVVLLRSSRFQQV